MSTGYAWEQAASTGYLPVAARRAPRETPVWWRDLVGSATWASMLVVVALWVSHGGLQDLRSLDPALTSLGRLTGLVSADLMLIQVLLMARVPVIERAYGQDELARRHRLVGFTSFTLMVVHIALITLGYATTRGGVVTVGVNAVKTFYQLVRDEPGILLALAGTGLLVLVTVTSIKRARAKLRYESWHLLHLYAYLGVGLALPHEVWTGQEFNSSAVASAYWWTLYALAAGAVLVWRVAVPLLRTRRSALTVDKVVPEGPGVVSVHMTGRHLDRLHAAGGQFFTWRFADGPGWTRGNPYSLSAAPTDDRLRITVKNLGDGSGRLADLEPGTKVLIEGPYGRLHAGSRTRDRVTLIASGIGITPMRAMLEEVQVRPGDLTLIYRASSEADLIFRAELDELASATGARVFYVVGPRIRDRHSWLPQSAAHLGDAQALQQLVPDIADHDVFVCGADAWMDAVEDAALEAGVPHEQLHVERFSW